MKAYEEVADFIARRGPREVAGFRPSAQTLDHVSELLQKEKTSGLNSEERRELDHYEALEFQLSTINPQPSSEDFWALRDVSFSVRQPPLRVVCLAPRWKPGPEALASGRAQTIRDWEGILVNPVSDMAAETGLAAV